MYEDLVKQLKDDEAWKNCDFDFIYDFTHQAADAIEELSKQLDNMNEANIALYGALPKWIPVEERLPESQGPFLTRYGFGDASIETGQFFYGVLYYLYADADPHWQHASVGVEVTHWMPLPRPPVEQEARV